MLLVRIVVICAAFLVANGSRKSTDRQHSANRRSRRSQSCPESEDGHRGFLCPSAAAAGQKICIDSRQLCDGAWDCSQREDEHPVMCLFYNVLHYEVHHVLSLTHSRKQEKGCEDREKPMDPKRMLLDRLGIGRRRTSTNGGTGHLYY